MNIKRTFNKIAILSLCIVCTSNILAANLSVKPEDVIKPYIDDQTFSVIHVNLEKLNIDACINKAIEIINQQAEPDAAPNIQNDLKNFQTIAGTKLKELVQAGGKDFFVVFSMYDFPYFFVAVPIRSSREANIPNDSIQLYKHIQNIAKDFDDECFDFYAANDLILAGLKPTIERLKTISPVQSELFAKSLQACGDTTIQAVLFPSPDQHRIFSELLPKIHFGSGMIDLTILGKELSWAALGFNTPPNLSWNFTIQSQNSEGADNILSFIKNIYKLVEENPKAQEFRPQLDQLLEKITPQKKENQLLLQADSKTANSIVNDFIAPSFMKVRDMANQVACAKNLSSIGKALLIYANDYEDSFPPNLELLTHLQDMPPKGLICPSTRQKESYIYRGADLETADDPGLILVYDKKGNHKDGRNVLFLDSHVDWLTEDKFLEFIRKDNEYRKKTHRPEIPAK